MTHIHSVYDTDKHFVIDGITRTVKNVSETKTVVVQHDHNSERLTFELPRYIDGHDMSTCNVVQVHYNNIDAKTLEQSKDLHEVDDLQISPDDDEVVICSWLIHSNATKHVGKLNFVIRFVCSSDGKVDYAWNTAVCSCVTVTEGIYNTDDVAEGYSDILEQWRQIIEDTVYATDGKVDKSGWTGNKLLGTDADGNVIETDPGLTEVEWEDVKNKPFYDESVTSLVSFDPLPTVTFDAAGYTWWKCSELVLTREQILKTTILTTFAPGTQFAEVPKETDIVVDEENFTGVLFASGSNAWYIFCRATGEHTVSFAGNPVTFVCPEVGVYMGYPVGQTPPTTISVGIGYKDVKTLDAKYLPAEAVPVTIDLSGYESNGKIIETFADGSTETTTMTFDSEGRPSTITDNNGNVTTLTW